MHVIELKIDRVAREVHGGLQSRHRHSVAASKDLSMTWAGSLGGSTHWFHWPSYLQYATSHGTVLCYTTWLARITSCKCMKCGTAVNLVAHMS